jgi:parvulin-like peptidyl-prolyl isomerase
MAKSSKKRKQQTPDQRQTKKQIALGKKQARQNRIIYLSLAAVVVIILIVVAVGLIVELVVNPAKPVGRVNDTPIRSDDFRDLLQYRRYNTHITLLNLQNELRSLDPDDETNEFVRSIYEQQMAQLQSNLALAPEQTLDELIDDALVREKAEESGIAVTEEEVLENINEDLQLAAAPPSQATGSDAEQALTPTPVPQEELDAIYDNVLANMGLADSEFRSIVKRGLYRTKLQELLASQVVTTGLIVHPQLIQTDTQEEATAALERIGGGEDFAVVASEVSTDTFTAENGGDLDWVTTGQLANRYGEEVENAVFALAVGEIDQIESNGKFYVVSIVERDEDGPLPADVVSQRQASALSDWLTERKESPDVAIERLLEPEDIPPDPFQALQTRSGPRNDNERSGWN